MRNPSPIQVTRLGLLLAVLFMLNLAANIVNVVVRIREDSRISAPCTSLHAPEH